MANVLNTTFVFTSGNSGSFWINNQETIQANVIYYTNYFAMNGKGLNYGYSAGGNTGSTPINSIQYFPFASDTNSTDGADLVVEMEDSAGHGSSVYGFTSGGENVTPTRAVTREVNRYPFYSVTNASDVNDLTSARCSVAGHSSYEYGFTSGGSTTPTVTRPATFTPATTIDKFPFSSTAALTSVGALAQAQYGKAGISSESYGYAAGGDAFPTADTDNIERFPFASNANATDVADLFQSFRRGAAGISSQTHGYIAGGDFQPPGVASNTIDKFPFASGGVSTDVANLLANTEFCAAHSYVSHGYVSGGQLVSVTGALTDTIQKFTLFSDADATDVGNLLATTRRSAGTQV